MKRSEAIQKLRDRFWEITFNAEVFLDFMEKQLGMLPPSYDKKLTEKEKRVATDYYSMATGCKKVNKWEEE